MPRHYFVISVKDRGEILSVLTTSESVSKLTDGRSTPAYVYMSVLENRLLAGRALDCAARKIEDTCTHTRGTGEKSRGDKTCPARNEFSARIDEMDIGFRARYALC